MDAQVQVSTPDNYRLFSSATPLQLLCSASPALPHCMPAWEQEQKRTAISTAALNARVDGQLHRFPYSLAG